MNTDINSRIVVFRCGNTRYAQGNSHVTIDDAFDLATEPLSTTESPREYAARTREAECLVETSAALALVYLKSRQRPSGLEILSSPTGRCLHTANIISDVFNRQGESANVIRVQALSEAWNFNWKLFWPLVKGGTVSYNGKRYLIDIRLSNPNTLSASEYFASEEFHHLPAEVKAHWSQEYIRAIEKFESPVHVQERMLKLLRRAAGKDLVLITHAVQTGFLTKTFTRGSQSKLPHGSFIVLEGNPQRLLIKAIDENIVGDSETNVLDVV